MANCSLIGQFPTWQNSRTTRLDKEWLLCYPTRPDCRVVSIGVGLDWLFDVAAEAAGCEVYSFDPTVDLLPMHTKHFKTFQRQNKRIHFEPVGLGASTAYSGQYGSQGLASVMHLDALLDKHVGVGRGISVLKIDCEGCEWAEMRYLVTHAPRTLCRVSSILQFELHFTTRFGLHNASDASLLFRHVLLDHGFRPSATIGVNGVFTPRDRFADGLVEPARLPIRACCYNVRFVRHSRGRFCRANTMSETNGNGESLRTQNRGSH